MKCKHPPCAREASTALGNYSSAALKCRGLCWRCYCNTAVRSLYPSTSKFAANKDHQDFFGPGNTPEPTAALPGSGDKVAVLCGRAERGEYLFHLADRRRGLK